MPSWLQFCTAILPRHQIIQMQMQTSKVDTMVENVTRTTSTTAFATATTYSNLDASLSTANCALCSVQLVLFTQRICDLPKLCCKSEFNRHKKYGPHSAGGFI